MSQFFQIHPDNPQARLIRQAVDIVENGGVIAYPTDSGYALGCQIGNKQALERVRRIRQLDAGHNFTLVCRDLSELGTYARVDNNAYRLVKAHTPGPYTFILPATREVPKRLMHPKKKTIGLRVPDNRIALDLLECLDQPLLSVTLILPGEDIPMTDAWDIRDTLQHTLDLVIDGGFCGMEATTIIEWVDEVPNVLRQGAGDASAFLV